MSDYIALYRKFRPPTFDDVRGQDHIVTTLKNQIRAERIGHAYLFTGTRGTGKTSVARILARAVNCEHPKDGNPCGNCDTCRAIESAQGLGTIVEIDAASNNGVENIREIIEEVSYSPTVGRYKVYIIDEAHMITTSAFNALLKTLEEPPSYCIFILATTDVQKVPITILSRCQRYDFRRIDAETIVERLREVCSREAVDAEDRALSYIARKADGSMRDSLSLLDQCIAFHYGETLTFDRVLDVLGAVDATVFHTLFERISHQEVTEVLQLVSDQVSQGRDLTQFVSDFVWYLRDLMLVSASPRGADAIDMSAENLEQLRAQAAQADLDTILRYIHICSGLLADLRQAVQKRILVETALIRLCKPQTDRDEAALRDRLRILEAHDGRTGELLRAWESGSLGVTQTPADHAVPPVQAAEAPAPAPRILPEAVPEDVRQIVQEWPALLQKMDVTMRHCLNGALLSLDQDRQLLIVLDNPAGYDMMKREDSQAELDRFLSEQTGKRVPFELRLSARQERERLYPDLRTVLGTDMDIEEEDFDPDDID